MHPWFFSKDWSRATGTASSIFRKQNVPLEQSLTDDSQLWKYESPALLPWVGINSGYNLYPEPPLDKAQPRTWPEIIPLLSFASFPVLLLHSFSIQKGFFINWHIPEAISSIQKQGGVRAFWEDFPSPKPQNESGERLINLHNLPPGAHLGCFLLCVCPFSACWTPRHQAPKLFLSPVFPPAHLLFPLALLAFNSIP